MKDMATYCRSRFLMPTHHGTWRVTNVGRIAMLQTVFLDPVRHG